MSPCHNSPFTRLLIPALLLSIGCPSPPSLPAGSYSPQDEILLRIDGQPIRRREIADKVIELSAPFATEQYIGWRLRENQRHALAVSHSKDELLSRAQLIVDRARSVNGKSYVQEQLKKQGVTEREYVKRIADTPDLDDRLSNEKLFIYAFLTEPAVEMDAVTFQDREPAEKFSGTVRDTGNFDPATLKQGSRLEPLRWIVGTVPRGLEWIPEDTLPTKTGEISNPQEGPDRRWHAFYARSVTPGNPKPYPELKDIVFQQILERPPTDQELSGWIHFLKKKSKIEYADRNPARN